MVTGTTSRMRAASTRSRAASSPSSSRSRNGLPPLTTAHAVQTSSPVLSPSATRTSSPTAPALRAPGRSSRAAGSALSAASRSPCAPGSGGQAATATATGRSSTRVTRKRTNRSEARSHQCASSTTSSTGWASARFDASQYSALNVATDGSTSAPAGGASPSRRPSAGAARRAAPASRSPSASPATVASKSWAYDGEGEVAFELGAAGGEDAHALARGDLARCAQQARLADAGGALDDHEAPAALPRIAQRRGERAELVLAFEQHARRLPQELASQRRAAPSSSADGERYLV